MTFEWQVFLSHPWALWLLVAVVSGLLEVSVPYFTFTFVSLASLVAMCAAICAGNWIVQFLSFAVALVLFLMILRPRMLSRLHKSHAMPSRSQALVGCFGEVTESIDAATGTGRILVNGQDWAAKSEQIIAAGQRIVVEDHDGIVLIVKEI
jgi:membrane protein implicated in regulation of membrane protease activity